MIKSPKKYLTATELKNRRDKWLMERQKVFMDKLKRKVLDRCLEKDPEGTMAALEKLAEQMLCVPKEKENG